MEENQYTPATAPTQEESVQRLAEKMNEVREEIHQVIVGQREAVDLMLIGLLADGHLLIEGVPGVAKTLAAKVLAKVVSTGFARIQFTPDLMPGDVIGTTVFNQREGQFYFKPGPIFSNIVLIDEINRAPAKTQSALFEVMEERQITIDGTTHLMQFPFLVVATQNPIEQEGTYRLPEAQLDRFLFKIEVDYPSMEEEVQILSNQQGIPQAELLQRISPKISAGEIAVFRNIARNITIEPKLVEFIARIVNETRNNAALYLGASTRSALALLKSSKAAAALKGRDFVIPEDIIEMAPNVLRHRIMLTPDKEMEGYLPDEFLKNMLKGIEIPRWYSRAARSLEKYF